MNRIRIFLGIMAGLVVVFLLREISTGNIMTYISIVAGSFIASMISGRVIPGVILSIIVVVIEAIGFCLVTGEIASLIAAEYIRTLYPIYVMEITIGVGGGWAGAALSRYIFKKGRAKGDNDSV